jgi:hypothetical protein
MSDFTWMHGFRYTLRREKPSSISLGENAVRTREALHRFGPILDAMRVDQNAPLCVKLEAIESYVAHLHLALEEPSR